MHQRPHMHAAAEEACHKLLKSGRGLDLTEPLRKARESWSKLIRERCGFFFDESRLWYLERCLLKRMRELSLVDLDEYYRHIVFHPRGDREWESLQALLLNHESSFFRHQPSFDALASHALPRLLEQKGVEGSRLIEFWSAGCSTGEEAYSIAMTALEVVGAGDWNLRLLGTDLSRKRLEQAERGLYADSEVEAIAEPMLRRYFLAPSAATGGKWSVGQKLRSIVRFEPFNLMDPATYPPAPQDVIFCQNVLIYFGAEDRKRLVEELCHRLNRGGYLFLAPVEFPGVPIENAQIIRWQDALLLRRMN